MNSQRPRGKRRFLELEASEITCPSPSCSERGGDAWLLGTVPPSPSGKMCDLARYIQGMVSIWRSALPSPFGGWSLLQGAQRQPARMMPGAEDEDIAFAKGDAPPRPSNSARVTALAGFQPTPR